MKKLYAVLVMVFLLQGVYAQVKFRIAMQPDEVTYEVYLRPDTTWNSPFNYVPSAQLALRLPTGGFVPGNVVSNLGQWTNNAFVVAPTEAPDYDYLAFALASPTSDITFTEGQEVLLFSFQNTGTCTGVMNFIDNKDDPFLPPNSQNVNIGNQISVAAAGQGVNAYRGPYVVGGNDCADIAGDCGITYNGVEFNAPSTCGARDATIEIFATTDLGLPLQYSIDDAQTWQSDPYFDGLAAGDYHIWIRDIVSICLEDAGIFNIPGPLAPTILTQNFTDPDCGMDNGTITVTARLDSGDPMDFSIDGVNWQATGEFTGLAEGSYTVRVRNAANGCVKNVGPFRLVGCPPAQCLVYYELELLADGRYQVNLQSDTTYSTPANTTSNLQVTIKAPTGSLVIDNFRSEIPNVNFEVTGTYVSPTEDPASDYYTVGLTTTGTRDINYLKDQDVALFSFGNAGVCSGDSLRLMNNDTDPFFPPNSMNGNVGQQLSVLGYGSADAPVCLNENYAAPCLTTPEQCISEFHIRELAGGEFQVSMIPDSTFTGALARTSEMLVTVRTAKGGFEVGNLTSLVNGISFEQNDTYREPTDNPDYDYFNFTLVDIGTDSIKYVKGEEVPLFTFENVGICSNSPVELMDPDADPYMMPNTDATTVGIILKIAAMGADPVVTCLVNEATNDCPNITTSVDTLYVTMRTDMAMDTCLGPLVELLNSTGDFSVCGQGTYVTVTGTNGSDCITLTPNSDFHETDEVCVIHCDSNIPDYCDTTYIIICPQVVADPAGDICPGESTALSTFGGAGDFTWTPASGLSCTDCPDPDASPAATTTYTITADDGTGCRTSDQVSVTVNEEPQVSFDTDGFCAAAPTNFTNTSTGDGANAVYEWDFGDSNNSMDENPSHQYAGNGTYTVTLTITTSNGCSASTSNDITITASSVGGNAYNFDGCEGESIQLSASAGINYSWTPSTGLSATDVANPSLNVTGDATYLVNVTDANGCGQIDTVFVNVLPVAGGDSFTFEGCEGEQIQLSASAGTTYEWSPATGLSATDVASPTLTVTNATTYFVKVTGATGCGQIDTVFVEVNTTTDGTSYSFEACEGETIQLSASAGVSYNWSPATGLSASDIAEPDLLVTGAATYYVNVTGATGCGQTDTVYVNTVPPPIIIDVLSEDPTNCDDPNGSIKVFATDGGNPLEYSIDCGTTWQVSNYFPDLDKDTFCVMVRSTVTGCTATWPDSIILVAPSAPIILNVDPIAPSACGQEDGTITVLASSNNGSDLEYSIDGVLWQDSPDFTNLGAGDYYVWVRVKGGEACEVEFLGNPITILDPNPPTILTPLDSVVTCDGVAKTVSLEISEDIQSFTISGGGAYTNASFAGSVLTFDVIPAGSNATYNVDIEGVNGCAVEESFRLYSRPGPDMGIFELSHTLCGQETGFFLLIVSDGSAPFRYDFAKNDNYLVQDVGMNGNVQTFPNLGVGVYDVTVVDDLGCTSTKEVKIDIRPSDFGFSEIVENPTCNNNNGRLGFTNAPADHIFEWLDADSNFLSDQAIIEDLAAGQYQVRITAPNGCYQLKNFSLNSAGGPAFEVRETYDVACAGDGSGAITFVVQGTGTFTATIPTTNISETVNGGDTITLAGLEAGWFNLLVSDDNNCTSIESFNIKEDPIFTFQNLNDPTDCLAGDGEICLRIAGGREPFKITGDAGTYFNILEGDNICLTDLGAGIFHLTITDAVGCEIEQEYTLSAPDQPSIDVSSIQVVDIICPEDINTGKILSNDTIEFDVYTLNNQFLGTTPLENLGDGTYKVVFEKDGCRAERQVDLDAPAPWDVEIVSNPETCDGYDGSIELTVSGANGNYNFDWADGINNIGYLATGLTSLESYTVNITDQYGCSTSFENLAVDWDCDDCDDKFSLDKYNGAYHDDDFEVCLPLTDTDINTSDIFLNGETYTGPINNCSSVQVFYEFNSLLNLGQPPYQIIEWDYGTGVLANKRFDDLAELVVEMNSYDPLGNWRVDLADNKIQGGTNYTNYGKFVIEHLATSTTLNLAINEKMVNRQSITVPGEGDFTLIIQDNGGRCSDTLEMSLTFREPDQPGDKDTINLQTSLETTLYNICLPVDLTGNLTISLCEDPQSGTTELGDDNCFDYAPDPGFVGTDEFCIEVCNDEGDCMQFVVNIEVGNKQLIIYTAMSPNEDGQNDYLYIENIQFFPDNKVVIFNRWGNLVYEKDGYSNDLPWHGTFGNQALPDGTYYYIVEDGTGKKYTGYLQINR